METENTFYRDLMDNVFLKMLAPYFSNAGASLQLAIATHSDILSPRFLAAGVLPFFSEFDAFNFASLGANHIAGSSGNWFLQVTELLNDSRRSGDLSLHAMGPDLYANAGLACLQFIADSLNNQELQSDFTLVTGDVNCIDHGNHDENNQVTDSIYQNELCIKTWEEGLGSKDRASSTYSERIISIYVIQAFYLADLFS